MGMTFFSSSSRSRRPTPSQRLNISHSATAPRNVKKLSFKKILFGFLFLLTLLVLQLLSHQWAIVGQVFGSLNKNTVISRQPAIWSWHYYNQNNSTSPKILIAQTTGMDSYLQLLDITQRVNRAYARKYGYDYVVLEGVVLGGYKGWHSTFAKIEVLHVALEEAYDAALILDSDALLVNFDVDIASLLNDKYALTAQRVAKHPHTWDVNAGVILWNLRHDKTKWISNTWQDEAIKTLRGWRPIDDQRLLHYILKDKLTQTQRNATINSIDKVFQYDKGTVVKHFARHNKNRNTGTWNSPLDERIVQLKKVADETCLKYKPHCEGISTRLSPNAVFIN